MKEFLEPLQHDTLFGEEDQQASGEGGDNALMSFGSEALARAISERGGFGIADRIIRHFRENQSGYGGAPSGPEDFHKINGKQGLKS